MKLHLPKRLFTALLAAITLAASPVAKGAVDYNELGIVRENNCYAHDYTFSFILNEDAFSGVTADANGNSTIVLASYWSSNANNPDSNAIVLIRNRAGDITLKIGRGEVGSYADLAADSTFAFHNEATSYRTLDTNLEVGTVYTLYVTGGDQAMDPTLYSIAAGSTSADVTSYKGNMNGNDDLDSVFNHEVATLVSKNVTNTSSGTATLEKTNTLVWAGAADEGATSANWGTWNNISGTSNGATADATSDLIFDAASTVAKEVNITGSVTVGSISVYDDYTFIGTGESAASLSVTNGITIADGKTLTLTADAESTATNTINGAVTGGSLNIAGGVWNAGDLRSATFGSAITVSGGVLEYTGSDTEEPAKVPHFVSLLNSVATSGSGLIRVDGDVSFNYQNTNVEHHNITIEDNVEVTGTLSINSHGSDGGMRTWTVDNKGTLTVGEKLWLTNMQKLVVAGGTVNAAGGIQLGHHENTGSYESRVEMSSGSLVTSGISFLGPENSVELTGGTLIFRPVGNDRNVLLQGTDGTYATNHGGTVSISGVNLVADTTSWIMDGGVLSNLAVNLDNVTVAAGNTHGITLKNVTLAGSIVNNAELALGSGVTVAAGGSATVTGGKVQILNTLASAGTLNLNTDAIYVSETLLGYQTVAGTFEGDYSLDGFTLDEGGKNGFQLLSGTTYYLSVDANVTTTLNKVWRDQNTCYDLVSDDSGLHFTVDDEQAGSVYYINSGDVTVDSAVQSLATSYVVQGGNMKMTEGSISRAAITYTSGGITLGSDATLTNLTASNDGTLMGNVTGSGTMEVAVSDTNWNDTINTSAGFTGTVYVVSGHRFTYDSDKLGSTLKLATGVNMQVNNGGRLDDTLVLESGNHEVHVNGTTNFYVTGTISGEGTFDKRGGNSTVYIKDNASVENYRNGVGTTTVLDNAAVINLTAADGAVNVQGGTVTNLKANGGTSTLTGGSVSSLVQAGGTVNVQGGTVTNLKANRGTSTLTGGSVSSLVLAGGTVNVQGGSLTDVNYNGSGGSLTFMQVDSQDTTYTLGTIGSSSSDNYTRHLTVNSGVAVNAVNLLNTWGMGTITVDGALNISEELKFSTGDNNGNTENNKLTGSGSVTTRKLTIGNVGMYNFSNVNLTVGDGGVAMDAAKLEITSGTMTFDGRWNGTGGTVNLMGGDIFFNCASGVNVMNVLDIAGANVSTAQVSLAQDVKLQVNGNMWLAGTAAINLAEDAELKKGSMAIIGTGNESTVKRLTSGNDNAFSHNSDDHVVTNAHVNMTSGSAATLALKLDNTAVTNAGAGVLTVSNSNNSITNLAATGGNVTVSESMGIDSISAANGKVVSVAAGKTVTMEGGTTISTTDSSAAASLTAKSDAALVQMQQDASFTIADMTLTNTTITVATVNTQVSFDNVTMSGAVVLRNLKVAMSDVQVAAGGSEGSKGTFKGSTTLLSGITMNAGSSLTVDLGDLSSYAAMGPGKYDLSITLSGFSMADFVGAYADSALQFAADSWLGKLLAQSNNANVEISISQAADVGEAAAAGAATGVSYSTGSVGTIITITGLNVPEPTTSTLSLLALAGLCARRRRKM